MIIFMPIAAGHAGRWKIATGGRISVRFCPPQRGGRVAAAPEPREDSCRANARHESDTHTCHSAISDALISPKSPAGERIERPASG